MYRGNPNPLSGHCYIASEALFYLTDKRLKPMFVRHEGKPHWFLKNEQGKVIDLTSKQFKTPVPYHTAVGKGFLTKKPSKRARIVIQRVKNHG